MHPKMDMSSQSNYFDCLLSGCLLSKLTFQPDFFWCWSRQVSLYLPKQIIHQVRFLSNSLFLPCDLCCHPFLIFLYFYMFIIQTAVIHRNKFLYLTVMSTRFYDLFPTFLSEDFRVFHKLFFKLRYRSTVIIFWSFVPFIVIPFAEASVFSISGVAQFYYLCNFFHNCVVSTSYRSNMHFQHIDNLQIM